MSKLNKTPLVSVILPAFNAGDFLAKAIESILSQTYQNFELLIVDDGSTDNSWEILKFYQENYPQKIKTYHFLKNKGESEAANFAFSKTRGEFVARMDADDISYPQRLEKQVKHLLKNPQVIVLGSQAEVINENGELIGKKTFPKNHKQIYKQFTIFHPMLHPSCMFRRSLLPIKNYLYENKFEPNDEYYTFFKLLNYGKFANLPEILMKYRIHGRNKSLQKPKEKFINSLKVRAAAMKNLGYRPSFMAIVLMFLQVLLVGVLPEKLIVPIYMLVRGMYSASNIFPKWQNAYEKKLALDSYFSS